MKKGSMFRLGAAGGIIFVAMQMIAQGMIQVGGAEPPFTASAGEILDFFAARDPLLSQLGGYTSALSFVPFIWFLGAMRSVLRGIEGEGSWMSDVAFGCGLISTAISVIGGWDLAIFRIGEGLDPQIARLGFDLGNFAFASTWVMLGGMLLAVGTLAFRPGAMPRWVGWASLVIAVGLLGARFVWTSQVAFVPYVLYWIWLIGMSVALLRSAKGD